MKRTSQIIVSLVCVALWQTSSQAATKYWDIDGATPGAGGAGVPAGTWDVETTPNWTTDSSGSSAATTFSNGDDVVFSAGTDALGPFTVSFETLATAGNLTVEEGDVTIGGSGFLTLGGGTSGKGILNVAATATNTISATVDGNGDDAGFLRKTGAGRMILSGFNSYGATMIVAEGILAGAGNNGALGSSLAPTIVSNGATLMLSVGGIAEPVTLNGQGQGGGGALRATAAFVFSGAITLDSASRINADNGQLTFTSFVADRNFDLSVGGQGSVRLNVNGGFKLGSGKLIKDGAGWVQTEGVVYTCSAVDFNDGIIRFRELPGGGFRDAANVDFVTVTVAPTADEIRNVLASTINFGNPMTLGATNLLFTMVSNSQMNVSGIISGANGGLSKGTNLASILYLDGVNTYGGNTIVEGGTLIVGTNGSIANSALIEVRSNANFDVTTKIGGFTIGAAQTLKGSGAVAGDITVNGTLVPGSSIGIFTFSNNLTLGNNMIVEVDKSADLTSDLVSVAGNLNNTGSGTVTVNNLGPTLAPGDTFTLFDKPVGNGGALTVTGANAVWNNQLAVNGTIVVVSVTAPPEVTQPRITSVVGAGTSSVTVNYTNTLPGTSYTLQYNTNLNTTNWFTVGTLPAGGTTSAQTDNTATGAERYYRVYYVAP